jgi:hypothetical protein
MTSKLIKRNTDFFTKSACPAVRQTTRPSTNHLTQWSSTPSCPLTRTT